MSSKSKSKFPKAKTIVSTIGSIAAATMVVRSVARDYLPREFRGYLYTRLCNFINTFSTHLTMVIYESDGFQDNELYNAIQIYISEKMSSDIHRIRITKNPNHKKIAVAVEIKEEFMDVYNGVKFYWSVVAKKTPSRSYHSTDDDGMSYKSRSDLRSMELKFHRDQKEFVLNDYLPLMLEHAEIKEREQKTMKLFTLNSSYSRKMWTSVNLDHPANFDTLAMDSDVKEKVIKDLDRFVERREYYRKVGKAWKRGYLLYGPPGTGKSSLIAPMANYMNFDIYDLELADVKSNSDLRSLLLATTNRSILVVEDIDCSVELHNRVVAEGERAEARKKRRHYYPGEKVVKTVTLSGFLNFIDGLWSSCGVERIIIFTTNQKDKLDPALLRPGRMDVHIHMSYCTPCGFRLLASNYLGISQHDLFNPIEDLILQINVTPAEVAEQLLKDDDPDIALDGLIEFFHVKRKENEEAEARAKKIKEEKEVAAKEKELAAKEKENKAGNEIH